MALFMLLAAACGTVATPSAQQTQETEAARQGEAAESETEAAAAPTETEAPPTATSVPPTDTSEPPTATSVPPSNTPEPPTATPGSSASEVSASASGEASVQGDPASGEMLFTANGCSSCHNTASEDRLVGPGLLNVGERAATRVEGMSAVEYIRHSILEPGAFVVEGFPNVMPPTFAGTLTEQQVNDLIAYLLTL